MGPGRAIRPAPPTSPFGPNPIARALSTAPAFSTLQCPRRLFIGDQWHGTSGKALRRISAAGEHPPRVLRYPLSGRAGGNRSRARTPIGGATASRPPSSLLLASATARFWASPRSCRQLLGLGSRCPPHHPPSAPTRFSPPPASTAGQPSPAHLARAGIGGQRSAQSPLRQSVWP